MDQIPLDLDGLSENRYLLPDERVYNKVRRIPSHQDIPNIVVTEPLLIVVSLQSNGECRI